ARSETWQELRRIWVSSPGSIVARVLEQDDVRLRACLAGIRHVHRGFVDYGAHFFARAAADTKVRIHVRTLELHREDLGFGAARLVVVVALRHLDLFGPNGLRGRRAKLLAYDARRRHRPRQAPPLIVHRGPDRNRLLTDSHLLLFGDLLNGARGAHLA